MSESATTEGNIQFQIKDRKLGSEWAEWDGCISEHADSDSGKRLFIGLSALAFVFLATLAGFSWYLIQPRLAQLSSIVTIGLSIVMLTLAVLFAFWLILNFLSLVFGKNLLLRVFRFEFSLTFLAPIVMRMGERFGVDTDRISNSFIKVSNSLTRIARAKQKAQRLLLMLPHCLQKNARQALQELAHRYQIGVYVVPGGSVARRIIIEQRPDAVVAVACERDLLAGMLDLFTHIPVLGIPNRRPQGPCKNTNVDLLEIENAIKFFLRIS